MPRTIRFDASITFLQLSSRTARISNPYFLDNYSRRTPNILIREKIPNAGIPNFPTNHTIPEPHHALTVDRITSDLHPTKGSVRKFVEFGTGPQERVWNAGNDSLLAKLTDLVRDLNSHGYKLEGETVPTFKMDSALSSIDSRIEDLSRKAAAGISINDPVKEIANILEDKRTDPNRAGEYISVASSFNLSIGKQILKYISDRRIAEILNVRGRCTNCIKVKRRILIILPPQRSIDVLSHLTDRKIREIIKDLDDLQFSSALLDTHESNDPAKNKRVKRLVQDYVEEKMFSLFEEATRGKFLKNFHIENELLRYLNEYLNKDILSNIKYNKPFFFNKKDYPF